MLLPPRSLGALAITLLTLSLAACGSSDSGGSGSGTGSAGKATTSANGSVTNADGTMALSDLSLKADDVCQKAQQDTKLIPAPDDITDFAASYPYFKAIQGILDQELADLTALKPDAEGKAAYAAFLAVEAAGVAHVHDITEMTRRHDTQGLSNLPDPNIENTKINNAADRIGASSCKVFN